MNHATLVSIEWAARSSHEGSAHFGEIVRALLEAGVESYHADYRANRTTYYLPNGETHSVPMPVLETPIAEPFDAAAVLAAIRAAQRGEIIYPQFMRLTRAAGCVGYMVWLAGRHVSYFGRRGEVHLEHFPQ